MGGYSDCFILSGISKDPKSQKTIKKAMYIKDGKVRPLYKWSPRTNEVIKENLQYYQMSYAAAHVMLNTYLENGKRTKGDETLRISIWLEDAKYDDLHLLCIDFDKKKNDNFIRETPFFLACKELADFQTLSQSGGVHLWFGIDRKKAEPLFDEINLRTHRHTKSFICNVNLSSNGEDKFDVFCDNGRIIHEYEPWQPNRGVTDKTQELYELFKQSVSIAKKEDIDFWADAQGREFVLEGLPEDVIVEKLDEKQKLIFIDLKENKDPSCPRNQWFLIGCNLKQVFGEEVGGSIWLWWSRRAPDSFQTQSCVNTWGEICRRRQLVLRDPLWEEILEDNVFKEQTLISKPIPKQQMAEQIKLISPLKIQPITQEINEQWAKVLGF